MPSNYNLRIGINIPEKSNEKFKVNVAGVTRGLDEVRKKGQRRLSKDGLKDFRFEFFISVDSL